MKIRINTIDEQPLLAVIIALRITGLRFSDLVRQTDGLSEAGAQLALQEAHDLIREASST